MPLEMPLFPLSLPLRAFFVAAARTPSRRPWLYIYTIQYRRGRLLTPRGDKSRPHSGVKNRRGPMAVSGVKNRSVPFAEAG